MLNGKTFHFYFGDQHIKWLNEENFCVKEKILKCKNYDAQNKNHFSLFRGKPRIVKFRFSESGKKFLFQQKKSWKKVFSFFIGPTRAGGERNWTSGKGHLPEFKRPQTIHFLTRLCENDEQFKAHFRFYDSLCNYLW